MNNITVFEFADITAVFKHSCYHINTDFTAESRAQSLGIHFLCNLGHRSSFGVTLKCFQNGRRNQRVYLKMLFTINGVS